MWCLVCWRLPRPKTVSSPKRLPVYFTSWEGVLTQHITSLSCPKWRMNKWMTKDPTRLFFWALTWPPLLFCNRAVVTSCENTLKKEHFLQPRTQGRVTILKIFEEKALGVSYPPLWVAGAKSGIVISQRFFINFFKIRN